MSHAQEAISADTQAFDEFLVVAICNRLFDEECFSAGLLRLFYTTKAKDCGAVFSAKERTRLMRCLADSNLSEHYDYASQLLASKLGH